MRRLIPVLLAVTLFFCGCSEKEEYVPYDLTICDSSLTEMCEYLDDFEDENFHIMESEFSDGDVDILIKALNESSEGLTSVTVYSDKISDKTAQQFIDFAKKRQLPVTFALSNISTETLESYDKAFCITTNYILAGEITAEKIKELWADDVIIDADDNLIFTFATVKDEEISANMQAYYDTLIAGIELYGVPMQINSDISPDEVTDGDSLVAFNETNEALIIADKDAASYINDYTPYGGGVELITITEGTENTLSECPFVLNCFVDYTDYKLAADEIIRNYKNRQYPLIEISYPVIGKTVFIPAVI